MKTAYRIVRGKLKTVQVFETEAEAQVALGGGKRGWVVLHDRVAEVTVEVLTERGRKDFVFRAVRPLRNGHRPSWHSGNTFRATKKAALQALVAELLKDMNEKKREADKAQRKYFQAYQAAKKA